jgi:hypothetical protein
MNSKIPKKHQKFEAQIYKFDFKYQKLCFKLDVINASKEIFRRDKLGCTRKCQSSVQKLALDICPSHPLDFRCKARVHKKAWPTSISEGSLGGCASLCWRLCKCTGHDVRASEREKERAPADDPPASGKKSGARVTPAA